MLLGAFFRLYLSVNVSVPLFLDSRLFFLLFLKALLLPFSRSPSSELEF